MRDIAASGKSILFVGTKKQAQDVVEQEAKKVGMHYVNARWLGGMLTNFKTIRRRIDRLNQLERMEEDGTFDMLTKKEVLGLRKEHDRLERYLGGIREMKDLPGALFIVDPRKEHIAIKEARRLGIPIIGICDTNCDPDEVDLVIPANDDAVRAVKLIVETMTKSIIEAREGTLETVEEVSNKENEKTNEVVE